MKFISSSSRQLFKVFLINESVNCENNEISKFQNEISERDTSEHRCERINETKRDVTEERRSRQSISFFSVRGICNDKPRANMSESIVTPKASFIYHSIFHLSYEASFTFPS